MIKTLKLLFLLVITGSSLFTQWHFVRVDSSTSRFADICVVDQSILWTIKMETSNNIFKSTNGGLIWTSAGSIPGRLYFISAINNGIAWVSDIEGNVFKTTNGGMNWIQQSYQPKQFINYLKFFDENTGFFMTDAPSGNDTLGFFYTRNGGMNWIRSHNTPVINYIGALVENCVNTLDTNFIWFCANIGNNAYKFYKLTGGFEGVWQAFDYGVPGFYRNAVFKNSSTGIAVDGSKTIITTNGGINWSLRSYFPVNAWIADFMIVPGSDWVILNTTSKILFSRNLCQSWSDTISYFDVLDLCYSDSKDTSSIWVSYNLGQLLKYGNVPIGISVNNNSIPEDFELHQNYPNPFNPNTVIRFFLPEYSKFSISVFDLLGQQVYSISDKKNAGTYEFEFIAADIPSGVYFYRFVSGKTSMTRKMILLK